VEQAAGVLEQVDAELPDSGRKNLTGDELQELLLFYSQYQDRLDCEHRALSALELRAARLLGVPPHLEQAPPIELCQKLHALQERYHRSEIYLVFSCLFFNHILRYFNNGFLKTLMTFFLIFPFVYSMSQ